MKTFQYSGILQKASNENVEAGDEASDVIVESLGIEDLEIGPEIVS